MAEMKTPCRKNQHSGGDARLRGEGGQALVEFAFAFPLQLLIVFGIVQLALIFVAKQVVQYASFAAARAAVVAETPDEAWSRAGRTAALICAPITGTTISGSNVSWADVTAGDAVITIPGWGQVPKSGISSRLKTFTHEPDFSVPGEVRVTVTHYYELPIPVVSKLFAWAAGSGQKEGFLYDTTQYPTGMGAAGSTPEASEAAFESSTGIWNITRADHIRLRGTSVLVIAGTEEERLGATSP